MPVSLDIRAFRFVPPQAFAAVDSSSIPQSDTFHTANRYVQLQRRIVHINKQGNSGIHGLIRYLIAIIIFGDKTLSDICTNTF